MRKGALLVLCLLLPTFSALSAGCDEGRGQCYYFKNGERKSQSACKITVCANKNEPMTSLWNWDNGNFMKVTVSKPRLRLLINDRPAYSFPLQMKQSKMSCYGISGTDELICNDSGVF